MKNISVLSKVVILLLLFSAVLGGNAAAKNIKVALFPFEIHARQNIDYLKREVPRMVKENIEKEGAQAVVIDKEVAEEKMSPSRLKALGIKYSADYLVFGSIFSAAGRISIDVKMVNTYEDLKARTFYSEAGGVENLLSAVNELSRNVISDIFRKKLIVKIEIQGNKRIEDDAVLRIIETEPRDILDSRKLSEDLNRIYKMGYFEDVEVIQKETDSGVKVVFKVAEKPSVRKVVFRKNHVYETEELREVVATSTGSILNIFKVKEDVARIRRLYKEKNYHNCNVSYEIEKLPHNQADLIFNIEEGDKLYVEKITFEGNAHFDDDTLKDHMKTAEKGFFHWFTSSGELDKNELERDALRLESYYKNHGFADAKVADPEVQYRENHISVRFNINEGIQYRVGKIDFKGDIITSAEEIFKNTTLSENELYSREDLRTDVFDIVDYYADRGFANADVSPSIQRDPDKGVVDITVFIQKGSPVYFERILISGNTKTRDKVIRRELRIYEKGLYSKTDIQRSLRNLKRLDYFENIDVRTARGTEKNRMNLEFKVAEKQTGAFTFGGGYSSEENAFVLASVEERNLFGRGQTIKVKAEVSSDSNKYGINFIEPWLFDIPLSAGVELYNWDYEYDYYDKESRGGAVNFSYEFFDKLRPGIVYGFEDFTISDVDEDYTTVEEGTYVTSSLTPYLVWDTRDRTFVPTEGSYHKASVQYAGRVLGGEIDFTKYRFETAWYFPLFWKFVGVLHGKTGYLDDQSSDDIDIDYERFYLGGINSIRGFDSNDIDASEAADDVERGGEKFFQINIEMTFPLVEDMGLSGVIFYDQGDVFREDQDLEFGDNYSSFGGGFRWQSPLGPIRVEYGSVIEGKHIEKSGSGRWQFTVGAFF